MMYPMYLIIWISYDHQLSYVCKIDNDNDVSYVFDNNDDDDDHNAVDYDNHNKMKNKYGESGTEWKPFWMTVVINFQ